MFRQLVRCFLGGLQDLLAELPGLVSELLDARRPILGLVVEDLVQRRAGGIRVLVVESLGTKFPAVQLGDPAQAMHRAAEATSGFAEDRGAGPRSQAKRASSRRAVRRVAGTWGKLVESS